MDRHMAASLDHWLTTPPEEREPRMDLVEFVVFIPVPQDIPPGDECQGIREALEEAGYEVEDVGWVARPPIDDEDEKQAELQYENKMAADVDYEAREMGD